MKNLITLLSIVFIFSFALISCTEKDADPVKPVDPLPSTEPVKPACLPVEFNSGSTSFTIKYHYDSINKLLRTDMLHNGTYQWPYFKKNIYIYDHKGNLSKTNFYYGEGDPNYYTSYEYDSNNRLVKETDYSLISGKYELYRYSTYEYTATSLVAKKSKHFVHGVIGNTSEGYETYEYTDGSVSKIQTYSSSGEKAGSIEITYDDKAFIYAGLPLGSVPPTTSVHNIIEYKLTSKDGETVIDSPMGNNSYRNTYEYNEKGFPVKRVKKDFNGRLIQESIISYSCK